MTRWKKTGLEKKEATTEGKERCFQGVLIQNETMHRDAQLPLPNCGTVFVQRKEHG